MAKNLKDPRGVRVRNKSKRGYYLPACAAKHGLSCYPKGRGSFLVGPGTAELPYEYMAWAAENSPVVNAWFECGDLVVEEIFAAYEGDKWQADKPADLSGFRDAAALWFVRDEQDEDTLRAWLKAERRGEVAKAIEAKLPKPKPKPKPKAKPKKEEDDGDHQD